MKTLLNRGLNFSILPKKLDITQVFVDYKQFERSVLWKEFHFGKDNQETYERPIFRIQKTNLPQKHSTPELLKTFLSAVKSDISDPRNRNSAECNLPPKELKALKDLINLQKERQIVIKACDKGAGIIILDFDEYLRACYKHLSHLNGCLRVFLVDVPSGGKCY